MLMIMTDLEVTCLLFMVLISRYRSVEYGPLIAWMRETFAAKENRKHSHTSGNEKRRVLLITGCSFQAMNEWLQIIGTASLTTKTKQ